MTNCEHRFDCNDAEGCEATSTKDCKFYLPERPSKMNGMLNRLQTEDPNKFVPPPTKASDEKKPEKPKKNQKPTNSENRIPETPAETVSPIAIDESKKVVGYRLSDNRVVHLYENGFIELWVDRVDKTGVVTSTDRNSVYCNTFKPMKRMIIDDMDLYQVQIGRKPVTGDVPKLLRIMEDIGGVSSKRYLSDCVHTILSLSKLVEIVGHATCGVYNEKGKLSLCLTPHSMSDDQERVEREISRAKTEELTKEKIQDYINVLQFWHPWEIYTAMSKGITSPFSLMLRDQHILVPYLYHCSQETDLGKTVTARVFSEYLYGVKPRRAGDINSDFRIASTLDAFCGPMVIDEVDTMDWSGEVGSRIKASAENYYQDKRGKQDRSSQVYLSRLDAILTGNKFPIKSPSELVRFIRDEFDSTKKKNRTYDDSKKLDKILTDETGTPRLKPIGFRLVEFMLKDINYDIHELVRRIETNADEICAVEVKNDQGQKININQSSRKPKSWGLVYEGLKMWEKVCVAYGVEWKAPTAEKFVTDIVSRLEGFTIESKETEVQDFIDWFKLYIQKVQSNETMSTYWKCHTLTYKKDDQEVTVEGWIVAGPIYSLYKRENRGHQHQPLTEIGRELENLYKIPYNEIYSNNWKFGDRTPKKERGIFIKKPDVTESTEVTTQ